MNGMTGRCAASIILCASTLLLTACDHNTRTIRAYGECNGKMGGGGECKVGAEIKWERDGKKSFLAQLSDALPDAASLQLDTHGSSIPYPNSGLVTLQVKSASTGAVIAAQQFQWTKTGTVIRLANPDSANTWLYANMGSGDMLSYDLVPFRSNYRPGPQTIAGQVKYEGNTQASYIVEFSAGNCGNHNSNQPCPIQ